MPVVKIDIDEKDKVRVVIDNAFLLAENPSDRSVIQIDKGLMDRCNVQITNNRFLVRPEQLLAKFKLCWTLCCWVFRDWFKKKKQTGNWPYKKWRNRKKQLL